MGLSERKNEALYQRMAVVREVEELATIAWNAFQMNMIRSDYMASEVRAYQRMVSSYDREFELATRSVLDLLVAENRLYNARFAEVNAAAILSYTGYRALAAQSQLAKHFGVKKSERVMATQISPSKGQKPRYVISKGRLLIEK
jgi:outer membrane protein TolC